ncbi:MAG: helix-turn-helix transcriptional regulator [Bacteroidia bacterium]|nr:helix-turn-helix transcriptional regulator [Bacteroidia bacterium]
MKEKIADKIRLFRLSKNYSQQNMADELGITVAAYSNIERGVTDITVTRLFQIAEILEMSALRFLRDEGPYVITEDEKLYNPIDRSSGEIVQVIRQLQQQLYDLQKEVDALRPEIKKPRRKKQA